MTDDHLISGDPNDDALVDEVLQVLAIAGIPRRDLTIDPEVRESVNASAAAGLEAILAGERRPTATVSLIRRGTSWGLIAAGAAAATVAVASTQQPAAPPRPAVFATPAMASFEYATIGPEGISGRSADQILKTLAGAASEQPPVRSGSMNQVVRTAGWWLTTTPAGKAEAFSELIPTTSTHVYQSDGQIHAVENRGDPLSPSGTLTSVRATSSTTDEVFTGPAEGPDHAQSLADKSPRELRQALIPTATECPVVAYCLVTAIEQLHATYVVPPALESNLWRLLGPTDGVASLGRTTDRLGRPAVAISVPGARADRVQILYADPNSGDYLGSEEVLVADSEQLGIQAPAVLNFTAVISARYVPVSK